MVGPGVLVAASNWPGHFLTGSREGYICVPCHQNSDGTSRGCPDEGWVSGGGQKAQIVVLLKESGRLLGAVRPLSEVAPPRVNSRELPPKPP